MSEWVIQGVLGGPGPTVAIKDTIDVARWPTRAGEESVSNTEFCRPRPRFRHSLD